MKGTIPVHPKEIEAIRSLVASAQAPTITYSESVQLMHDRARQKTRDHLKQIDDHLDELLARTLT